MTDRYYRIVGFFEGNQNFEPESVWTMQVGIDTAAEWYSFGLENMFQTRKDAHLQSLGGDGLLRIVNTDRAYLNATTGRATITPLSWMGWSSSLTLSSSQVEETRGEFLGYPGLIHTSRLSLYEPGDFRRWEGFMQLRQATSALADTRGGRTGGYGYADLGISWRGALHRLQARIDNLFDRRHIEIVKNYPLDGRVYSFGLELDL
jgi:outer membrane receptor protein involved in Fe transport